MTAESDAFNFNCWVSIARMPDPQRLLGIENEVLQFQFFPIVILIIFSRNANISFSTPDIYGIKQNFFFLLHYWKI